MPIRGSASAGSRLSTKFCRRVVHRRSPALSCHSSDTEQQTAAFAPAERPRRAFSLSASCWSARSQSSKRILRTGSDAASTAPTTSERWLHVRPQTPHSRSSIPISQHFGFASSNSAPVKSFESYKSTGAKRLVGLSRWWYLMSKFLWMGGLTAIQSLILFAAITTIHLGAHGAIHWQVIGLILLAFASTGIGLTVSAFAKSAIHAVLFGSVVPDSTDCPFLVFSPPAHNMPKPVLWVSQLMPSFAAERITDVSFLLNQKITGDFITDYRTPYWNINDWYRWKSKNDEGLTNGTVYTDGRPLWVGYLSLILWTGVGFAASFWLLIRRERE